MIDLSNYIKEAKENFRDIMKLLKKAPKKIIAIDFNQANVNIIYLEIGLNSYKVLANSNLNVQIGDDNYSDKCVNFIKSFIQSNNIEDKEAVFSLSDSNSILIKNLVLPVLPKNEVVEAARWQLKDEAPFDLEQSIIEWRTVKETTDDDGVKKNISIFALAQKSIIQKYLNIIIESGLSPVGITNNSFSYENLLYLLSKEAALSAILDIGYKETSLNIYFDNKLAFQRQIPVPWNKLVKVLTETVMTDKLKVSLSYEEAERVLQSYGIPTDNKIQMIKDGLTTNHLMSLIGPLLETLIREIKLSFDYFSSKFDNQAPASLFIAGYGLKLKGFDGYLKKELKGVEARYLVVPEGITFNHDEDMDGSLVSISAALNDYEGVNLLPLEIKTQKSELIQKATLRLIAIISAAIFLILYGIVSLQIKDYKSRIKIASVHLQTIDSIKVLGQKIFLVENLASKSRQGKLPVEGVLKTISNLMPPELILDELSLEQANGSLLLRGFSTVNIQGAEKSLTKFMQDLEQTSFIAEASLVSSKQIAGVLRFEIKCDLINGLTTKKK